MPRHLFVPAAERARAYDDGPVPIGQGQTISQPYIVALMTELVRPQPRRSRARSGHGLGLPGGRARAAGRRTSTRSSSKTRSRAAPRRVLRELEYDNVTVRTGDGYGGWPEHAPFDIIIVTAAPEQVPQPLIDQLQARWPADRAGRTALHRATAAADREGRRRQGPTRNVSPVMFVPLRRPAMIVVGLGLTRCCVGSAAIA